jgi:hypothetical protein
MHVVREQLKIRYGDRLGTCGEACSVYNITNCSCGILGLGGKEILYRFDVMMDGGTNGDDYDVYGGTNQSGNSSLVWSIWTDLRTIICGIRPFGEIERHLGFHIFLTGSSRLYLVFY